MYIKDGQTLSVYQLQQAHPNTPMPIDGPNDAWLIANGYEMYVEPPSTPDPAAAEAQRIAALWQAATGYEQAYIANMAIGLLAMGVMQGKPKCAAVAQWSYNLWNGPNGYYARKANGSTNYDYSDIGPIPYSVPELSAEVYGV